MVGGHLTQTFRHCFHGRNDCVERVNSVKLAIDDFTPFKVLKVISEYVWFDTCVEMDKGWIDYTPEELTKMFRK